MMVVEVVEMVEEDVEEVEEEMAEEEAMDDAPEVEALVGEGAEPQPGAPTVNERYVEIEAAGRASVRNTSAQLIAASGGVPVQFEMQPPIVVVGALAPGAAVGASFNVQNVSPDIGRFRIAGTSEGVEAVCEGGPVGAGMSRVVTVTVTAPTEDGPFEGSVHVTSEFNKYVVAIQGVVVADAALVAEDAAPAQPEELQPRELDETRTLDEVKEAERAIAVQ